MRCAAREGADVNPRTNDTMARDALPVNCCPAHSGFVYLSAELTTGGKRRSARVFLAKIRREWKSAGKENNIGGKESAMADGERKHLFPTRHHSISSQKPTAKIANVPRMGREGGSKESLREIVCLCRRAELHWKQSLFLQESPPVHASFKFHLRRRRPTD